MELSGAPRMDIVVVDAGMSEDHAMVDDLIFARRAYPRGMALEEIRKLRKEFAG
jgi:regulator of RNase E activity RraA